ncbi:hypothetical protein D8674_010713 [Pyrus ussuriensis x Pyrus communis]|uniref:PGG domain-containing protein n=1 Tax=Pyrus ussuriensis x Pyrus communis TaxID=2448454 RepID=A0A5N5FGS2_9ROSA|nr:hypothetical protein D8674_010713 [Pyrus ussuriensis x Pyrus communis]
MALEEEVDSLFESAMKGEWGKVVEAYRNSPKAQEAKITKSNETALHIAIADGQTEIAIKLLNIISPGGNASKIFNLGNEKGNTALHLAARLGYVELCEIMATKDQNLVSVRNLDGETPLFLAAHNGNIKSVLCLHSHCQEKFHSFRDNNGDTILHAAISGEYFCLAFQIIRLHPELANSMNENGLSPLHILAGKPNAFKSSTRLGLADEIIYRCLIVDDHKIEAYNHEACLHKAGDQNSSKHPANYETCMNFFRLLRSLFKVLTKSRGNKNCTQALRLYWNKLRGSLPQANGGNRNRNGINAAEDEENPRPVSSSVIEASSGASSSEIKSESKEKLDTTSSRSTDDANEGVKAFPPNYASFILFWKLMMKALLIILGIGIWKIKKIQEKKERHIWANQVMNELVQCTSLYKYQNTGQNPNETHPSKHTEEANPSSSSLPDHVHDHEPELNNDNDRKHKKLSRDKKKVTHDQADKKQTPILIAAKMGVTEIVEKILDKFPVAVQDVDSDQKNVVLLAVENRQPHVYNLLQKRKLLKESLLRQLDNQGNSALHLAATCGQYRPWLIPGAALQMQWEIKWYKFVKSSMPHHFFVRYNKKGQTPKEIFIHTHRDLMKEGSKWLIKTSESCSVVAALIATVAFATSATVPGGLDQTTGEPILKDKPAFGAFTISSLVALCFSVTSLVFFLSILTSRYEESDFSLDLPRKLLMGLTSLFASIASIIVSFCAGHIFVLKHQLKFVAYPLYAATCLPVTFFAFAQLPLYFDLMRAIIKKVPQRSYEVFTH